MNSKQIEYAVELSKTLNFSGVAKKFGISQPALSKHISNLEKDINVKLFDRTKTPIVLTAAGEFFLTEAKELLYKETQLYRSMEQFRSGAKGQLVIGISPFRSMYLLPKICKKVKDKYPGVKIILDEDKSDVLRRKTAEGKFNFAIVNLPVDELALDTIPIEQDTLILAVPKDMDHLIKSRSNDEIPKVDFKDCEELPFIVVSQNQEMRHVFENNCYNANIHPTIAMEVVGLSTAWEMVCAGIGATLLPLQYVQEMSKGDNVSLFIPQCITNIRQPVIILRRGQFIPEYAKYAIELLKENNK